MCVYVCIYIYICDTTYHHQFPESRRRPVKTHRVRDIRMRNNWVFDTTVREHRVRDNLVFDTTDKVCTYRAERCLERETVCVFDRVCVNISCRIEQNVCERGDSNVRALKLLVLHISARMCIPTYLQHMTWEDIPACARVDVYVGR